MDQAEEQHEIERIRQALASDPRVNELELEISLAGDAVYVTGTVPHQDRHDAVTQVIRELVPGRTIRNQTTVVSLDAEPHVEQL